MTEDMAQGWADCGDAVVVSGLQPGFTFVQIDEDAEDFAAGTAEWADCCGAVAVGAAVRMLGQGANDRPERRAFALRFSNAA